jgi:hypothetical protein
MRSLVFAVVTCVVFAVVPAAQGQSLNVDFGSVLADSPVPSSFGAAADQPGPWNKIVELGLTENLQDVWDGTTEVSVTVEAESIEGHQVAGDTAAERLKADNFLSYEGETWRVLFEGLIPGRYDVYVYAPYNTAVVTGNFRVNDYGVPSLAGNDDDQLEQGVDWEVVPDVYLREGVLDIRYVDGAGHLGVSGIQLVFRGERLIRVVDLPAGDANCPAGGVRIDLGYDDGAGGGTAADGVLDDDEVHESHFACNGEDGTDGQAGTDGTDGDACTLTENADGTATLSCPDGTSHELPARDEGGCVQARGSGGAALLLLGLLVVLRLRRGVA